MAAMRYRLRTLIVALAIVPPLLGLAWTWRDVWVLPAISIWPLFWFLFTFSFLLAWMLKAIR